MSDVSYVVESVVNRSVEELIADNLIDTFDGKTIAYADGDHTIIAERQRQTLNINGRYPFVEIGGPWTTYTDRDNRSVTAELNFGIVLHDDTINDESLSSDPVSRACGDAKAELIRLVMADIQRGGHAVLTRLNGSGYILNNESGAPGFLVYLDITVQAYILETNPSQIGA